MRSIKKQFSLRRIVLIIGIAAIAIPITARVTRTTRAVVTESHGRLVRQIANDNENAAAKHSKQRNAAADPGIERRRDRYDRRREYWEKRVESRLDRREKYLDEQTGDDNDDADVNDTKDSKGKKDPKASKDEDDEDEDDSVDNDANSQEETIERRREYLQDRLDRRW